MKIVLFDWGGVLVHKSDWNRTVNEVCRDIKDNSVKKIKEDYLKNIFSSFEDFALDVSDEELCEDFINSKLKIFGMDYLTFKEIYVKDNISTKNTEVVKLLYKLKNEYFSEVKVGVLSNQSLLDVYSFDSDFNDIDFNFRFISCELGMKKPEKEIYSYVENNIKGNNNNDILFIDDRKENLEVPKNLGWKTILYDENDFSFDLSKKVFDFLREN